MDLSQHHSRMFSPAVSVPESTTLFGSNHQNSTQNFAIHHFIEPSTSDYQLVTRAQIHGKRKSSNESTFHPVTKQQITEARIASSMQRLSLNSNVNDAPRPSSSRTSDEGFYEDVNDIAFNDSDDEGVGDDLELTEDSNKSNKPQFSFAPGIREQIKKLDEPAIPKSVLQIMNQASLALIPYTPPSDLYINYREKDEKVSNEKKVLSSFDAMKGLSPKIATENDEMMAEWDNNNDMMD